MDEKIKITFNAKNVTVCPVCEEKFRREELHTGGGRIIVDSLTNQLRHTYKPSKEYGIVNPLLYPVTVCPNCMYAAFKEDFPRLKEKSVPTIRDQGEARVQDVKSLFPMVNFVKKRSLPEGISSYYLALHCYEAFSKDFSPTFRQAICALRCAWLCEDMAKTEKGEQWELLAKIMYRKSRYLYRLAIEGDENGSECFPEGLNYGPDTDKNYGVDGIYYLSSFLEYHHGPHSNREQRISNIKLAKIRLSRIFGMGVASKIKPQVLLEYSRAIHEKIKEELERNEGYWR